MNISYRAAQTDSDFEQILALQKRNHYTAISKEVQNREGFVYAEHNLDILKSMSVHVPQIVALTADRVIGYTLAMTPSMKNLVPSLTTMFGQFDQCSYKGTYLRELSFVVGGQVCVAEGFRGMGIAPGLYHALSDHVKAIYVVCVTEIAQRNQRSLKAHQKIGFEIINIYVDNNETWDILAWDMTQ